MQRTKNPPRTKAPRQAAPDAQQPVLAAVSVILYEETKGACNLIQLAGKFKAAARKEIAGKFLGRQATPDESNVSDLRLLFGEAMGLDGSLTGEEADDLIAARAIELVKGIDAVEAELAQETEPITPPAMSEEPIGEQSPAGSAAEDQQPPTAEGESDMKTKTKKTKATAKKAPAAKAVSTKPAATNGKAPKSAKAEGGLSLLGAAAKVLERRTVAMNVKKIYAKIIEDKLWTPGAGKTPEQTLAAGLITEINKKGKDSRFKKDAPGKFLLK